MKVYEFLDQSCYEHGAFMRLFKDREDCALISAIGTHVVIGKDIPYSVLDDKYIEDNNIDVARSFFNHPPGLAFSPFIVCWAKIDVDKSENINVAKFIAGDLGVVSSGEFVGVSLLVNGKRAICVNLIPTPLGNVFLIQIRTAWDDDVCKKVSPISCAESVPMTGLHAEGYPVTVADCIASIKKALVFLGETLEDGDTQEFAASAQKYMPLFTSERWIKEGVYP